MEENLKIRFLKYIEDIEKDEDEDWDKLGKAEKLIYRTADVIQFFKREVRGEVDNEEITREFENIWHYLLGTVEMRDNDPMKYSTSEE